MSRRLTGSANASRTGARAIPSDVLICRNTGDSSSDIRIRTDNTTRMVESRNGMRQPQRWKASAPRPSRQLITTASDSRKPPVVIALIALVQRPRVPGGALSAT